MATCTVWRNARLATMSAEIGGLGVVEHGAIAATDERIVYCGPETEMPHLEADQVHDCEGRWITPGLIDCHTHLVFGGDRLTEFELRLAGARYEDLAAVGGIRVTVAATRKASESHLLESALARLDGFLAEGVTTLEAKSGYGLDDVTELAQLHVARQLGEQRDVEIVSTYLGAHSIPGEYLGRAEAYVDLVCDRMIPQVASGRLADCVDVFCDTVALSPSQTRRVLSAARAADLPVRLHADQLSDSGGAALAASYEALSADHLEFASIAGIAAMARSGTAAVLLPGAFLTAGQVPRPPIAAMRTHGVRIAIGTDLNPGSSPVTSPLLAMGLAANLFGLTVEECIVGMTRNAAFAVGRSEHVGTLETGKFCDLAIWSVDNVAELVYWLGRNPLYRRVWHGR